MRRRRKDPDTERGVGNALKTSFAPERASIEQFDDLIAKLDEKAPPAPSDPAR